MARNFTIVVNVSFPECTDRGVVPAPISETEVAGLVYELGNAIDGWVDTRISDDGPAYSTVVMRGIDDTSDLQRACALHGVPYPEARDK